MSHFTETGRHKEGITCLPSCNVTAKFGVSRRTPEPVLWTNITLADGAGESLCLRTLAQVIYKVQSNFIAYADVKPDGRKRHRHFQSAG